jgi:hypothetical protein
VWCRYHGHITAEQAEAKFKHAGARDGMFLVRSEAPDGCNDCIISVLLGGAVCHVPVEHTKSGFSTPDTPEFMTLTLLIEYLQMQKPPEIFLREHVLRV